MALRELYEKLEDLKDFLVHRMGMKIGETTTSPPEYCATKESTAAWPAKSLFDLVLFPLLYYFARLIPKSAPEVTAEEFDKKVLKSKIPVLVYFYSPTELCRPCKELTPKINKLYLHYLKKKTRKISVYKCEDNKVLSRYLETVPYLKLFINGKPHQIDLSAQTIPKIKKEVSGILEKSPSQ